LETWVDKESAAQNTRPRLLQAVLLWFDAGAGKLPEGCEAADRVDWARIIPFILLHATCLTIFWVGWSWTAVLTALGLYTLRMFAITGFYHRYFSHRAFKTSRLGQFLFGVLGASAVQRGPVWWAAHHRHHHAHSDKEADVHSPVQHGFLRAH
jgi:stearoyl-CoA desaturase (delta-9 desaturase)